MFSGLIQDWVTNDGNGTTPFVQSRSGWVDLAAFGDVTFWLDVRSVSPPGAGSVTLAYETSPTMDESAFKALASITLTTSPNPSLTHVALASNPGLGRYVRWKLTGTAAGNWSATFRIFVAAGVGAGSSAWAPTNATVPLLAWYRADTAHGGGGGQIDVWPDQSRAGDANRNQVRTPDASVVLNASNSSYGNRPTVDATTGHFDAVGAWSNAPITKPISILIVGDYSAFSPNQSFLASNVSDMLWTSSPSLFFYNGASNSPSAGMAINTPSVILFEDDGTGAPDAARLYINNLNTPVGTATSAFGSSGTIDRFALGFGTAGVSHRAGATAEVALFGGILAPTDKTNLVSYLNATRAYGIALT
jgi:hypothetical protein